MINEKQTWALKDASGKAKQFLKLLKGARQLR